MADTEFTQAQVSGVLPCSDFDRCVAFYRDTLGFKVELAPRRPGDPTQIVAACDRVRSTLGWQPRFDDLRTIAAHALAWERKLSKHAG